MNKRLVAAAASIGVVAAGAVGWIFLANRCSSRPSIDKDGPFYIPFVALHPGYLVDELSPGAYQLEVTDRCYSAECQISISASIPADDQWSHAKFDCKGDKLYFTPFGVEQLMIIVPPLPRPTVRLTRESRVLAESRYFPDDHWNANFYVPEKLKGVRQ